jgi:SAM-dependent methyltransferase
MRRLRLAHSTAAKPPEKCQRDRIPKKKRSFWGALHKGHISPPRQAGAQRDQLSSARHFMNFPACPVTGRPAVRHVQSVTTRLLVDLWRYTPFFRVDARPSFGDVARLDLWESPTGMYFFEPRREGDQGFYSTFYRHINMRKRLSTKGRGWRCEFDMASDRVKSGDKVLDVGCGFASFRAAVPQASYTGLDPNFTDEDPLGQIRSESLEDHLVEAAGTYDIVCAFQVVEHLADPLSFTKSLVKAAKPGGLIVIGVPHVPSANTRIPNFLLNAPPHHLTWWTKPALAELARQSGAEAESVDNVPWGRQDALMYWLARCSPIKCHDEHFKADWGWHAATVVSWIGGLIASTVLPTPKTTDEGAGLLMVARRTARARHIFPA